MADVKTRMENEQQAVYDAQNGLTSNPDGDQYYRNAYNAQVAKDKTAAESK